jgi:hypothetical protein
METDLDARRSNLPFATVDGTPRVEGCREVTGAPVHSGSRQPFCKALGMDVQETQRR